MSVYYELHDLKNQRRFDVGRGGRCFSDLHEVRASGEAALAAALEAAWALTQDEEWLAVEVARRIWRFCELAEWRVELWNDWMQGESRIRTNGTNAWTLVDTRYDDQPEWGGVDRLPG